MKKAKMLLAAIAVVAIVGGVFATKAAKRGTTIFCANAPGVLGAEKVGYALAGAGVYSYCTAIEDALVRPTYYIAQP